MFTGIIETLGDIKEVTHDGTNVHYKIHSDITNELKVDQSVAHNGVCLTVTNIAAQDYVVTAVNETLEKTNLASWKVGTKVNLERCMLNNGRFDGHIVQGHVDQVGTCVAIKEEDGSWLFDFTYDADKGNVTVEKGSITINGISLTCFNTKDNGFTVAIIPYTYEHTSMQDLAVGDQVNLEFDIVGKYVQRLINGGK
jgi:riboflavin synthase